MEQPPGSLDDFQPQDDSTSNIPTVIDPTRKGEDCFLSSTAPDALRMGKSPGWYPNSGTTNAGLQFSETGSSDITLQSGDQIQPDNAFSHTTVTLSYVSRSHVFTTHNSLSRHSPLYSVPPISKFSLHPHCDADNGLGETSYALSQHYLEQTEEPINLATQTELFQTFSQAQVKPENDGAVCLPQEPLGFNGEVLSCDDFLEKPLQEEEEEHSVPLEHGGGLENGELDSRSNPGACADSSTEAVPPFTGEDEESGGSEVLIIMSKKQDSTVVSHSTAAGDLRSLSRDYRSPLEDPVSPSATSLEDVDDVFILPQASSSPSAENSHLETPEEVACDSSSTEKSAQPSPGVSDGTTRLDSSDESKQPARRRKAVLEPLIDLTEDVCVSDVLENEPSSIVPHINGNAKVLERTLKERKLPVRTGRGTRLEAIVMNINSSRYNVSGCILTNKKVSASQSTPHNSTFGSPKRNDTLSVREGRCKVKSTFSVKTAKRRAVKVNKSKSSNVNTDSCKDSTSDSELFNKTKKQRSSIPPKSPQSARSKREPVHPPQASILKSKRKPSSQASPQYAVLKNSKAESEPLNQPEPSVENNVSRVPPPPPQAKSPKNCQGKTKSKSPGSEASPSAKTKVTRAPKRRRKKHKPSQSSSMFSPKEPEIKLRYLNYKEEKRDVKRDSFSPFIRVERQQASPSLCTIVNYREEEKTQHKTRQQAHSSGFISAVIPSTSCLQLGRASRHSQHQRALVCCLCGHSANTIDLGDLHGPYYPEGYQLSTKTPVSTSGLKEDGDNSSDSDSSSCSLRGSGRKCAITPTPWAVKQGAQLKQKVLQGRRRWDAGAGSPANKRARSDTAPEDVEDWYSPPVLPLEPCEFWLHEDCAIWSAGVFLVKGKVYGLEEAVKVAQETVCSACHHQGATLGCFFKACPNKYHYRCALESDCVLIEDNFSMKCKKHKNKTFKAPPGSRGDNR
ncbi:uncharacterized protein PAE49_000818 isoform 1-T2 [Odontesthes bonariensis]|uniref:uncharacterized protein LOC142374072 n=1 Tax=Odontesthes bonariensis TaxID=219752 RepID=UPI003F580A92